jgi:methionine-rich copper-binding protein CopC
MKLLKPNPLAPILALILILSFFLSSAWGHAFPLRSEPRVGRTTATPPPNVKIWFDGELEPVFSTIAVYNSAKQRVDKGNGRVSPSDATLLEVDLLPLPSGTYRVYWNVVAKDTHRTEGDFLFTTEGQAP